jgi:hypothetical protein
VAGTPADSGCRLQRPDDAAIVDRVPELDGNGRLPIPSDPGLGMALLADAAERFPERPRGVVPRRREDGSIDVRACCVGELPDHLARCRINDVLFVTSGSTSDEFAINQQRELRVGHKFLRPSRSA